MAVTRRAVVAGANVMLHLPSWQPQGGAGLRGILCWHGHTGKDTHIQQGGPWVGHPEYWAERGYVVGCAAVGDSWMSPASMALGTALADHMRDVWGVAGKLGVTGWSMGGGNGLRWVIENLARTAVAWFCSPASDLDWFHANQWGPEIDAVYGGAYAANGSPRSPWNNLAAFRGGPAIQIAHATNDPTVPYQQSVDFIAAIGDPAVTLRQPDILGAHQGGLFLPPRETWEFLRTHWSA